MTDVSATAHVDDRGRVVLPVALRRRLGLRAGDEVQISEQADSAFQP